MKRSCGRNEQLHKVIKLFYAQLNIASIAFYFSTIQTSVTSLFSFHFDWVCGRLHSFTHLNLASFLWYMGKHCRMLNRVSTVCLQNVLLRFE